MKSFFHVQLPGSSFPFPPSIPAFTGMKDFLSFFYIYPFLFYLFYIYIYSNILFLVRCTLLADKVRKVVTPKNHNLGQFCVLNGCCFNLFASCPTDLVDGEKKV